MVHKTLISISRICNNYFQQMLELLHNIGRVLKVDLCELLIHTND